MTLALGFLAVFWLIESAAVLTSYGLFRYKASHEHYED
jgi:hypothetical protein